MAPKAATPAAPKAKPAHGTYQEMISEAIINLKDRSGSSRQTIKKYIKANNELSVQSDKAFDGLVNKALRTGVEKGIFEQPKGPSGGTKLKKKTVTPKPAAAPAKDKAAAPAKEKAAKATTTKPAATKKAPAATKKAPVKKAATATKAKAAAKPKAAAAPKKKAAAKPKAAAVADAVVDKEVTIGKTQSGRVTKTTTAKPAVTKKAPAKKATPKKAKA